MGIWALRKCSSLDFFFQYEWHLAATHAAKVKLCVLIQLSPRTLSHESLPQAVKADARMCKWTPYLFLEDGRLNQTGG